MLIKVNCERTIKNLINKTKNQLIKKWKHVYLLNGLKNFQRSMLKTIDYMEENFRFRLIKILKIFVKGFSLILLHHPTFKTIFTGHTSNSILRSRLKDEKRITMNTQLRFAVAITFYLGRLAIFFNDKLT